MLSKALLAAALATTATSAFLMPPSSLPPVVTEEIKEGEFRVAPFPASAQPIPASHIHGALPRDFGIAEVPCPGCPLQLRTKCHRKHNKDAEEKKDDDSNVHDHRHEDCEGTPRIITVEGMRNNLNLFFKIRHGEQGDRLVVNNFELYPNVDVYGSTLMAPQIPVCDASRHGHHGPFGHHGEKEDERKHEKEEEEENNEEKENEEEDELKKRHNRHHRHESDEKDAETKHHKGHKDHGYNVIPIAKRPPMGLKEAKGPFKGHGGYGPHRFVEVPLGYTLEINSLDTDAETQTEVISVSLQIIQVNNVFVQNIPSVTVHLNKTADGKMSLSPVILSSPTDAPAPDAADGRMAALKKELDACTNVLCRWRAIIGATVNAHRGGCQGKAAMGSIEGMPPQDGDFHGHHHHHHHHHHEGEESDEEHAGMPFHHLREHSWAQLMRKLGSHVLFPVLVGITAGILVSVVGMVVGTVIVGLWRLVFRRRRAAVRAHHHHHRHSRSRNPSTTKDAAAVATPSRYVNEVSADEEKASLMVAESVSEVSGEELPPYEDNVARTEGSA